MQNELVPYPHVVVNNWEGHEWANSTQDSTTTEGLNNK